MRTDTRWLVKYNRYVTNSHMNGSHFLKDSSGLELVISTEREICAQARQKAAACWGGDGRRNSGTIGQSVGSEYELKNVTRYEINVQCIASGKL